MKYINSNNIIKAGALVMIALGTLFLLHVILPAALVVMGFMLLNKR